MKKLSIALLMCGFLTYNVTKSDHANHSGRTHRGSETPFASGSAMRASVFNSESVSQHCRNGNKGGFQFVAFGGKNTKRASAAAYFMPYGHEKFTVQGQQTVKTLDTRYDIATAGATNTGYTDITTTLGDAINNLTTVRAHRFTEGYDNNKDTSFIRPWNFGITHAATYDPYAANTNNGDGRLFAPQFKSTISPEFHHSHAGVGAAFRYHFSEEPQSFWVEASTAVEWVKNEMKLNEKVETEKLALNTTNFPTADISVSGQVNLPLTAGNNAQKVDSAVNSPDTMKNEVSLVWIHTTEADNTATVAGNIGTGWAVNQAVDNVTADIENLTQAYTGQITGLTNEHHKVWEYGKLAAGGNKTTKLADIEIKFGRNFVCESAYSSNGYVGIVIPTGNKATAEFLDEAIVGNGKHVGLMMGGTTSMELSQSGDWATSYRIDFNSRYLFKNTQKRSFDLVGNQGSRNLMVWEKAKWESARTKYAVDATKFSEARNYSAGINFFTKDMHVTPGFQARINQALLMSSANCFVELGWNISAHQAEKVSLTKAWTEEIAFPDAVTSPLRRGLLLTGKNTTYKNDTQDVTTFDTTTPANTSWNADYEIKESDINLESAASPQSITHAPYASLNYAFGDANSSRPGTIGVGGEYEFSQNNAAMSKWNIWGKLEFNF